MANNGTPGTCAKNEIEILFSPMYTAFDGVHRFQVPATVNGIVPGALSWSASDPSMVSLQPSADGVMITAQKAGMVTIVASAGTLCGSAALTITQASADDWTVGNARYNDGVILRPGGPLGGGGRGDGGMGGDAAAAARQAACTNCHGDTATMGPFRTVAHTPQQTGGFSDAELVDIVTKGILPPDGYFDETIVSKQQWSQFHRWDMTPEQAKGVIVYLRSLTPAPQKGMRGDFGGRLNRDGGAGGPRGDGGFVRREAGGSSD